MMRNPLERMMDSGMGQYVLLAISLRGAVGAGKHNTDGKS